VVVVLVAVVVVVVVAVAVLAGVVAAAVVVAVVVVVVVAAVEVEVVEVAVVDNHCKQLQGSLKEGNTQTVTLRRLRSSDVESSRSALTILSASTLFLSRRPLSIVVNRVRRPCSTAVEFCYNMSNHVSVLDRLFVCPRSLLRLANASSRLLKG
jgi:fructose-1,6-bisphosphatase/inositol monophosphatase family enzyme